MYIVLAVGTHVLFLLMPLACILYILSVLVCVIEFIMSFLSLCSMLAYYGYTNANIDSWKVST